MVTPERYETASINAERSAPSFVGSGHPLCATREMNSQQSFEFGFCWVSDRFKAAERDWSTTKTQEEHSKQ
jgi:hypothetical protein